MKTKLKLFQARLFCAAALGIGSCFSLTAAAADSANTAPVRTSQTIPWSEIGAKAGANYHGDGLAVTPEGSGARLHCAFQRLDGEATPEGLWLTSTVTNQTGDWFQVKAAGVGRQAAQAATSRPFSLSGTVGVVGQTVRFSRAGLVEEYTVCLDGVRQDFVVTGRPAGAGELQVRLAVAGARVEPAAYGAQLVLARSGRKIAYNRLRATDATGKELPARIEVLSGELETELAVVVNDVGALYPVRIDPTFSDANWISLGGIAGADWSVFATVADSSGNLYIGGFFIVAGNTSANCIARWNGTGWSPLGSGMNHGIYSAGVVYALAVSGTNLYAGGWFDSAGGVSATNIAQWNGSSWSALGSGLNNIVTYGVLALAVSGNTLYAGGDFATAGGVSVNRIAQWNGSSWSALGSGMNNEVDALVVSGGTLYAGGWFTTAGGIPANYIAQWNGSGWSALGSGMNNDVYVLAVSGSTLYAGGAFTTAGGSPANYIAQWNGSSWSALGSGMENYVHALTVSGNMLYAGGYSTTAGGIGADFIAQWNGSAWSSLGSGMNTGLNDDVYALAVSGNTLYVGGAFISAGGSPANCIAQWNGSSWSPLGSGLGGGDIAGPYVSALAVSAGKLYAGGDFTTAGGIPANHIAQWNGSSWSALGSGMDNGVGALAVSGNSLYVGGGFLTAGGSYVYSIAQWNGSSWSALGSGMNNRVDALAVSGGTVYAGGDFTTAGGIPANHIAQWNGSSWSALGSGMDMSVKALAVSGTNLYAGGNFTTAGGVSATNIAQWNGSSWSALGSGMEFYGYVYALAVSGNTLYAGGDFFTAGGVLVNHIAQWNGSSWSALGSGMGGESFDVLALALSGNTLYAGGSFTTAGRKVSGYAAEAVLVWPEIPSEPVRNTDGSITLNLSTGTNSSSRLYSATNLTPAVFWQPIYTNLNGGLWQFTDTNTAHFKTKFYRVSTP